MNYSKPIKAVEDVIKYAIMNKFAPDYYDARKTPDVSPSLSGQNSRYALTR